MYPYARVHLLDGGCYTCLPEVPIATLVINGAFKQALVRIRRLVIVVQGALL